ncbi:hypothetical protein LEP1GSC040_3951 [Leptospira santarosai str. 2000030832]|nr:hypothetical protein LEP1GSC040_3951 [Leptospira santarosai str. 2000030832]
MNILKLECVCFFKPNLPDKSPFYQNEIEKTFKKEGVRREGRDRKEAYRNRKSKERF